MGYKRHKLQQKYMMYPPYFGQGLESKKKKKVIGILAHVCFTHVRHSAGDGLDTVDLTAWSPSVEC